MTRLLLDQGLRIRREGLHGPEVAALLKRVWSEVGQSLSSGALVTVTARAIRLRKLPLFGEEDTSDEEGAPPA